MGAFESRSNDSMIDELVKRDRIIARRVERAFRLVDRGTFLPPDKRTNAYSDVPIKLTTEENGPFYPGPLHLSTTYVYASVVQNLDLRKGHSFLNIGSGVGYLSTIAGFLIGENGVNHGIEMYQNLVDYAEERIDEWMTTPGADCIGWTRPILKMCDAHSEQFLESHAKMYDRVYVGFILSNSRALHRVMRTLKIGGVLVAPSQDNLCRYTRISEGSCHRQILSTMNFAQAVYRSLTNPPQSIPVFERVPPLSHLTRQVIRREIRKASFNRKTMIWMSRTILVEKGGTKPYQPPSALPEAELLLENGPPIVDDADDWPVRVNAWIRQFPPAVPVRTRSSSTLSAPRSPVAISDLSTPEDDDWGDLEARGERTMNREMNGDLDEPTIAILARLLREPFRLRPQPEARVEPPEDNLESDPLFMDVILDAELLPEDDRPNGDMTDDDLSESEFEREGLDKPSGSNGRTESFHMGRWLTDDPQTDDETDFSDYEIDEPSTSTAPTSSQRASNKRSIPLDRVHRQKRLRKQRFCYVKKDHIKLAREEREKKCMRLRPYRDIAIEKADAVFQERVKKLPIPEKLREFLQKMQHEVIV